MKISKIKKAWPLAAPVFLAASLSLAKAMAEKYNRGLGQNKAQDINKEKALKAARARYVNTNGEIRRGVTPVNALRRMVRGDFKAHRPPLGGYERFIADWTTPVEKAQVAARPSQARITWLGHSSMLLQLEAANILIDPIFSGQAGPRSVVGQKRLVPAPLGAADLPPIDVVLISHNHYDHLDYKTVAAIKECQGQNPLWLVPAGLKPWFKRRGLTNVRELRWWEETTAAGLTFTFIPVQHWSKRGIGDNNDTLWGGFVVKKSFDGGQDWKFLYAGDTGYCHDFKEAGRRLGAIDLLAVPIGAYEPREDMKFQHINPAEAVRIFQDLNAKQALAVHWGTFQNSSVPFDQPPHDLRAALKESGLENAPFWLFKHGESRELSWN